MESPTNTSLAASARQTEEEEPWPGDRNPSARDAEVAYSPLNQASLPAFRQAVLAETQSKARASSRPTAIIGDILVEATRINPVFWPVGLVSISSARNDVEHLVHKCARDFLNSTPFLRDLPDLLFSRSPRPQYLTLAMACIGSMLLKDPIEMSTSYWNDSIHLMAAQLEVDNREARRLDLVKAWVLLETYGLLSSDPLVWKRTSLAHGYVETALSRIMRQYAYADQAQLKAQALNIKHTQSLVNYYRLVDVLRAVHYGQPVTLSVSYLDPFLPTVDAEMAINSATDSTPSDTVSLVALCHILVDIHSFKILSRSLTGMSQSTPTELYAPLSVQKEIQQIQDRLITEVKSWKDLYLASASPENTLLYLFCHMYLLAPGIRDLYNLARYPPGPIDETESHQSSVNVARGVYIDSEAASLAWHILETCERILTKPLPIWTSLAVFTAALIVSTDISSAPLSRGGDSAIYRLLKPFQYELGRINVPCVAAMLQALSTRSGFTSTER